MKTNEIIERLGLTVPECPTHFTDGQRNGTEALPAMTKLGIGLGSFTMGVQNLLGSFIPGPVARGGQNLSYGVSLGRVQHEVTRATKALAAADEARKQQSEMAPDQLVGSAA